MISPFNNPHRGLYNMLSLGHLPADLEAVAWTFDLPPEQYAQMRVSS